MMRRTLTNQTLRKRCSKFNELAYIFYCRILFPVSEMVEGQSIWVSTSIKRTFRPDLVRYSTANYVLSADSIKFMKGAVL